MILETKVTDAFLYKWHYASLLTTLREHTIDLNNPVRACSGGVVQKEDYENITVRILEEDVEYDVAIGALKKIAASGMFA